MMTAQATSPLRLLQNAVSLGQTSPHDYITLQTSSKHKNKTPNFILTLPILGSWHIARENVAILFPPAASFANRTGVELLTWCHFLRTIYRRELEPGYPHGADGRPNGSSSSPLPWRCRFYAWTCKQFIHPAALEPPRRINVWTGLGSARQRLTSISGANPIWFHSSQLRKAVLKLPSGIY